MTTMTRPEAPVPDTLEQLRHIRVLESQVEGNKEIIAALRDLRDDLAARIDDSTEETTALAEMALTRIDELREILHRLESKIDALANSLNGDGAVRSAQAVRLPEHTTSSSEIGPSCATSAKP
jgi:predicted RNase H-like nuclease (RuvC/YqgF family)